MSYEYVAYYDKLSSVTYVIPINVLTEFIKSRYLKLENQLNVGKLDKNEYNLMCKLYGEMYVNATRKGDCIELMNLLEITLGRKLFLEYIKKYIMYPYRHVLEN